MGRYLDEVDGVMVEAVLYDGYIIGTPSFKGSKTALRGTQPDWLTEETSLSPLEYAVNTGGVITIVAHDAFDERYAFRGF